MTVKINDYIELRNAKAEVVVRLVYVGNDQVLEHRRYRNILTNEMSDWRPADNAAPKTLSAAQLAEFTARKISAEG